MNPAPQQPAEALVGLRRQRVRHILWVLVASFSVLALMNLASGHTAGAVLEALAVLLLGVAYACNHRGRHTLAAQLILLTLLTILIALMTAGGGLMDEVPAAYPALLVFVGMFGSRRLLVLTTAVMLASLLAMTLWHGNRVDMTTGAQLQRLVVLGIALAVTTFLLLMVRADIRRLVRRLAAETGALAQSNARIHHLASYDELTGLPNRMHAMVHLERLLAAPRQGAAPAAIVALLDLDNFKAINDTLGHDVGDALLREVARRLQLELPPGDMVARLSGDEFLLLLSPTGGDATAEGAAQRLMSGLTHAFELPQVEVEVSASIGVSVAPHDGNDAQTLLKNADLAMYAAKASGRNAWRRYHPDMDAHMQDYVQLAAALRHAIAAGQLHLHYQPQVALASQRVVGAQALLCWQHPQWGWVAPSRFMPVAESCGLIHELGDWALHQACSDLQHLREQGLTRLTLAIHAFALQLRRGHADHKVIELLNSYGLPRGAIELQVTEDVLNDDSDSVVAALKHLRAEGVRLVIDDFGSGRSSLARLQRQAVHRLKIQPAFTRAMFDGDRAEGIVRAVIEMARCLHIEVVAEGIEDAATAERLRQIGCTVGQGRYWSSALPLDEFVAYARERAINGATG